MQKEGAKNLPFYILGILGSSKKWGKYRDSEKWQEIMWIEGILEII